jgi:hypothetical protein
VVKLLVEILIGLVASSLFVSALVAVLCRSHVRELWQAHRSRGEEAGVPEERDDEMAVARAAKADDFKVWEAECSKLQRLADRLGSRP